MVSCKSQTAGAGKGVPVPWGGGGEEAQEGQSSEATHCLPPSQSHLQTAHRFQVPTVSTPPEQLRPACPSLSTVSIWGRFMLVLCVVGCSAASLESKTFYWVLTRYKREEERRAKSINIS